MIDYDDFGHILDYDYDDIGALTQNEQKELNIEVQKWADLGLDTSEAFALVFDASRAADTLISYHDTLELAYAAMDAYTTTVQTPIILRNELF